MPYSSSAIKSFIQLKASSKLMSGSKLPDMVAAISGAASQYILSVSTVNSTNIALGPGVGTQTGRITALVPTAMSSLMMLKSASLGLSGKDIKKFYDAVSFGIVNATKSIVMQGTIIGAGPGTGTGKIAGLVPKGPKGLETFIWAQSTFRLLSGSKLRSMISCVAFGVCNHIMSTAVVTITNIGVAASPPIGPILIPAAPGIGRLV
jgi:hypothetical protein